MELVCDYGCGQPAKHHIGKRKRPCCSRHYTQCPAFQTARRATVLERGGFALSNPEVRAKAQQRIQEIYGVANAGQAPAVKAKIRTTTMERYGVPSVFAADPIKQRIQASCLERFGVKNPSQAPEVQAKRQATFQERFGGNPQQDPDVRARTTVTNQLRYGGAAPLSSPEVLARARATVRARYGPIAPWHRPEVRETQMKTHLLRYGVTTPVQRPDVHIKAVRHAFRKKPFTLPSGRIVYLQGYEPEIVTLLLREFPEEDLCLGKDVPRIPYVLDGVARCYIPDIYIPSLNLILEVKSLWTYQGGPRQSLGVDNPRYEQNQTKAQATVAAGYAHQFVIKDGDHWVILPLRRPPLG